VWYDVTYLYYYNNIGGSVPPTFLYSNRLDLKDNEGYVRWDSDWDDFMYSFLQPKPTFFYGHFGNFFWNTFKLLPQQVVGKSS